MELFLERPCPKKGQWISPPESLNCSGKGLKTSVFVHLPWQNEGEPGNPPKAAQSLQRFELDVVKTLLTNDWQNATFRTLVALCSSCSWEACSHSFSPQSMPWFCTSAAFSIAANMFEPPQFRKQSKWDRHWPPQDRPGFHYVKRWSQGNATHGFWTALSLSLSGTSRCPQSSRCPPSLKAF